MTRVARVASQLAAAVLAAAPILAHERAVFSMSVLVDGQPAPEYASRGRLYIEALQGKEFVIRLSNPTGGRVAVALAVDGRNVVDAKRTGSLEAAKWVLGPGESADIPGWQVSGSTARRFFFTETQSSYAKWLGDTANVGTIEAVFYREKRRQPIIAATEAPLMDRSKDQAAPSAAGEAKSSQESAASKKAQTAEADRFAATGIGDRTAFPVEWVAFDEDPNPAARIRLRYEFRPELVRLGVLPRETELYARDRARGFEHEYAPDPDRPR
jgi:hypothetical protein